MASSSTPAFTPGANLLLGLSLCGFRHHNITFPFLDDSVLNPEGNRVSLYKHVVHPDYANLFFVGLVQPWGAIMIMPLAEQQAEWIGDLLTGRCSLPRPDAMRRDIERAQTAMQRRYVRSARHTIQVDFYPYLAELRQARWRPCTG